MEELEDEFGTKSSQKEEEMGQAKQPNGHEKSGRFRNLTYSELCPVCKKHLLQKNWKVLKRWLDAMTIREVVNLTGIPKSTLDNVKKRGLNNGGGILYGKSKNGRIKLF
jgi:hypothetical protein